MKSKFAGGLRGTQAGTAMYGIFATGTSAPNPGFGAGWSNAGVIIPGDLLAAIRRHARKPVGNRNAGLFAPEAN